MKNEKVDYEIINNTEEIAWEIHIPYMEDITVEEMRKALTDALELLKGAEEAFIVAEASANCLPESNNYKGYDILLVKQGDCDIRNCELCFSK